MMEEDEIKLLHTIMQQGCGLDCGGCRYFEQTISEDVFQYDHCNLAHRDFSFGDSRVFKAAQENAKKRIEKLLD